MNLLNNVQPYLQVFRFPDGMPNRIGWRASWTPFSDKQPCMVGSFSGCLSYKAAKFVVNYIQDRPDYVEYYRRTVLPGESATVTLLCNAPCLLVDPYEHQYTRWTHPKTAHPDVFSIDDLAELIAVPQYFARKFDVNKDATILDKLDEILGQAVEQAQ